MYSILFNSDIMLLSNTLFYDHQLKCGSVGVASGKLLLPLFDEFPSNLPDWLCRAIDPNQPVVFLNTDQVLKYLAEYNVCVHRVVNNRYGMCV